MKKQGQKNIYMRPKLTYNIPKYKSSMKFCNLDEKYLRPTLYCDCRAPEIIALANELGAFKKSDREFAETAFEFAKRKIILEIIPLDGVVEVLQRGTGTCIHKISLFIALCRAAGIRGRYKFYALKMLDQWMQPAIDHAPLMKQWYDAMGYFLLHGEGEIYLDGKWIPADVGAEPQRQAAAGLPVTKLGEDSIGLWLFPIPGTITRRESVPLGLGFTGNLLIKRVAPDSVAGINIGILEQIERGGKIIEETGGEKTYDTMTRKKREPEKPKIELDEKKEIIFEG
ncbi:MAG: transglutaminase family protein [Candidatus Thermoplasmatota archaeon]|nr:transglutaminase family protein [Candidatus Thermoplasmatota archaeon]